MKRIFWLAAGLGAGVAGAVLSSRWLRRQRERLAPANLASQLAEGARDVARLLRESLEAGREEMERTEAEIRASLPE